MLLRKLHRTAFDYLLILLTVFNEKSAQSVRPCSVSLTFLADLINQGYCTSMVSRTQPLNVSLFALYLSLSYCYRCSLILCIPYITEQESILLSTGMSKTLCMSSQCPCFHLRRPRLPALGQLLRKLLRWFLPPLVAPVLVRARPAYRF